MDLILSLQAKRATHFRPQLAGEPATAEQHREWRELALAWAQRQLEEEGEPDKHPLAKKKSEFRVAARAHLQRIDVILQDATGRGLSQFVTSQRYEQLAAKATPAKRAVMDEIEHRATEADDNQPLNRDDGSLPLGDKRVLVQVEDSSTVSTCALWYSLYVLQSRQLWFPDSWHVLQNSLINAAKENQMMGMLRLTTTAMDAVFGPWSSQRWFETIIEGAAEALVFLRGPEAGDGLKRILRSLLPRIAVERGWTEFDDHEELALQALAESRFVRVKGERSQITRWFAWHRHFESWIGEASGHEDFPGQYQGEWTLRLIPLLLIGLSMGFVRADDSGDRQVVKELSTRAAATAAGQAAAATAADTAAADASAAAASSSTSRDKTAEQKLRDSCKNILHIATCIHGDRFLYSEALMFLYACRPLRDWYSHHRHNLRSQKACLQFYKDMAAGRCLEHVGKIGSLSQMELGKIGIFTEEILSSKSLQNLDIYDLEVRVQDNLAERLGGLVLSLQKFRLHGLVMYTHAFPYCIVGLLDEDPAANRLVQIFTRSKPQTAEHT